MLLVPRSCLAAGVDCYRKSMGMVDYAHCWEDDLFVTLVGRPAYAFGLATSHGEDEPCRTTVGTLLASAPSLSGGASLLSTRKKLQEEGPTKYAVSNTYQHTEFLKTVNPTTGCGQRKRWGMKILEI